MSTNVEISTETTFPWPGALQRQAVERAEHPKITVKVPKMLAHLQHLGALSNFFGFSSLPGRFCPVGVVSRSHLVETAL